MVTQKDLVNGISEELGGQISKKDIKLVLDTTGKLLAATMKDDFVNVCQGLSMGSVERSARVCRNPQNGEPIEVPAHRVPKAKFGKMFKEAVY